jgi:hypothetical protein
MSWAICAGNDAPEGSAVPKDFEIPSDQLDLRRLVSEGRKESVLVRYLPAQAVITEPGLRISKLIHVRARTVPTKQAPIGRKWLKPGVTEELLR